MAAMASAYRGRLGAGRDAIFLPPIFRHRRSAALVADVSPPSFSILPLLIFRCRCATFRIFRPATVALLISSAFQYGISEHAASIVHRPRCMPYIAKSSAEYAFMPRQRNQHVISQQTLEHHKTMSLSQKNVDFVYARACKVSLKLRTLGEVATLL